MLQYGLAVYMLFENMLLNLFGWHVRKRMLHDAYLGFRQLVKHQSVASAEHMCS